MKPWHALTGKECLDSIHSSKEGLTSQEAKERLQDRLPEMLQAAREAGLLLLRSGTNVIRLAPPLVATEAELDSGVDLMRKSLARFA